MILISFHDIPPHEPPLQASPSPLPRIQMWLMVHWIDQKREYLKVKFCDSNQQKQFWRTQEIVNNNPYIVYKIKQFPKWRATFHSTPKCQRLCFITVSFVSSSLKSKIRRVNLINLILHMHVSLYRAKSVTYRERTTLAFRFRINSPTVVTMFCCFFSLNTCAGARIPAVCASICKYNMVKYWPDAEQGI